MSRFDQKKLYSLAKNKFNNLDNKKLVLMFSILSFLVLSILSSFFYIKTKKPPAISDLATIEFYSEDNVKFFELNNDQAHTYVNINHISPHLISAIISIEDQHFFEHHGFDYPRIIKAIIDNTMAMSKRFGASTITQQYARNLYLNHEKSYERKIKEAYYTMLLENNYSKEEILEGYLNTIYFGHGVYGIADASYFYFNKKAQDLTIAEAAVLASIPKAPTYYSPLSNFEKNKERKEIILRQMFNQGKISEGEYQEALEEEIKLTGAHPQSQHNIAPFYQDIIVYELEKINLVLDEFYKGIKVYTTLDIKLNQIIEKSIDDVYAPQSKIETAVYAIDPNNGHVKAVIGGRNYKHSQYNRALAGMRHPGSTIKPLLYYAALEYGFTPTTTFRSEPTTFLLNNGLEHYSPSNFADIYANKDITMAYAIAVSDNIYAVKTHLFLGPETLVNTAHRLGITADMKPLPSLALGSTEIKLSEITTAYAHFASLGKQVKPVYITKITDLNDKVIYEYKPVEKQVLDPDLSFIMNHMLYGMFDTRMTENISVTGQSIAGLLSRKYAGKSGSTDYDNTMIGYNPDLVIGVWTGYDEMIPITKYEEKSYSKRLWADVVEKYFDGTDDLWFQPSENIIGVRVNPISGEMYYNTGGYTKVMYYLRGTEPPYRF